MSESNFDVSLQHTLKEEGGFSDHPKDPGGATMKGVTLDTYRSYKNNQHLTPENLKKITDAELRDIYLRRYWNAAKCNDLPPGVDMCVFDTAVNSGPGRASKILQECVGAVPDGVIGPKTLAAIKATDPVDLIAKYCETRLKFLRALPTFETFGKGWTARVERLQKEALALLK